MSKPHLVKNRTARTGRRSTKNSKTKSAFGWIDLDKSRARAGALILVIFAAIAAIGAMSNGLLFEEPEKNAKPNRATFLSFLNPFSSSQPGGSSGLELSKEYLYAESELLAVEDAGATSSPTTDLAIWRPSTGQWWTKAGQNSQQVTVQWGVSSDVPSVGDYDGDGKTDFCVFRPSEGRWYILKSSSNDSSTTIYTFGQNNDVPAPADYDGDGRSDMAVWRPSSGIWYITRSSDGGIIQFSLGSSGDTPSPKDFDGDGRADIAVWRSSNSTFYSINSSDGAVRSKLMGSGGDPVSADYDGDGKADYAVRSGSVWKISSSGSGATTSTTWQGAGDRAVQNDYDGDGRVDIAVWKPATGQWYILKSSDGSTRVDQWGTSGDVPVPALYRR